MTSGEHRAAVHLMVHLMKHLDITRDYVESVKARMVDSLRFLIAVSPVPQCSRTQVKKLCMDVVQALLDNGIVQNSSVFEEPFFGRNLRESQAFALLRKLPEELDDEWAEYWGEAFDKAKIWMKDIDSRAAELVRVTAEKGWDRTGAIELISERDMFQVVGDKHPPPTVYGKWGQMPGEDTLLERRVEVANEILQLSWGEGVTVENMKKLHMTFNVDADVEKAVYRKHMTVALSPSDVATKSCTF